MQQEKTTAINRIIKRYILLFLVLCTCHFVYIGGTREQVYCDSTGYFHCWLFNWRIRKNREDKKIGGCTFYLFCYGFST